MQSKHRFPRRGRFQQPSVAQRRGLIYTASPCELSCERPLNELPVVSKSKKQARRCPEGRTRREQNTEAWKPQHRPPNRSGAATSLPSPSLNLLSLVIVHLRPDLVAPSHCTGRPAIARGTSTWAVVATKRVVESGKTERMRIYRLLFALYSLRNKASLGPNHSPAQDRQCSRTRLCIASRAPPYP